MTLTKYRDIGYDSAV